MFPKVNCLFPKASVVIPEWTRSSPARRSLRWAPHFRRQKKANGRGSSPGSRSALQSEPNASFLNNTTKFIDIRIGKRIKFPYLPKTALPVPVASKNRIEMNAVAVRKHHESRELRKETNHVTHYQGTA